MADYLVGLVIEAVFIYIYILSFSFTDFWTYSLTQLWQQPGYKLFREVIWLGATSCSAATENPSSCNALLFSEFKPDQESLE